MTPTPPSPLPPLSHTPLLAGLEIHGADAAGFLQGYLTSDTAQLTSSKGQPTALTTLKGRVLANGWALRNPDDSGVLLALAADLVAATSGFLAKYLAFSKCTAVAVDSATLADRLSSVELPPLVGPYRAADFDAALVASQVALVTAAVSDQFLPQMLGLTGIGAVDFAKGCYLGQEIVARAEHRGAVKRRLRTLRAAAATSAEHGVESLTPGSAITDGKSGKTLGTIIHCARSGTTGDIDLLGVLSEAADDAEQIQAEAISLTLISTPEA